MACIASIIAVSQIEHQCAFVHREMLGKQEMSDMRILWGGTGGSLTDTGKEIYGTWNTATLQVLTISPGCSLILGE